MKSGMKSLAMLMALTMMESESHFSHRVERPIQKKEDTLEDKRKWHQIYGVDQTLHEFVINGVVIKATNKKVAKKIYNRIKGNKK